MNKTTSSLLIIIGLVIGLGCHSRIPVQNTQKAGNPNGVQDRQKEWSIKKTTEEYQIFWGDSLIKKILQEEFTFKSSMEIEIKTGVLGRYFVVYGQKKSIGSFCHIPEVTKVLILDPPGKEIWVDEERKSTILDGFLLKDCFQFPTYNSVGSDQGIIMVSVEGKLLGFLIVDSERGVIETRIEPTLLSDFELVFGLDEIKINGQEAYGKKRKTELIILNNGEFYINF